MYVCLFPGNPGNISDGACVGYIIGFLIGVILICVFVYVYVVVWNCTTKEIWKLVVFIVVLLIGVTLIISLSVAYANKRKENDKMKCSEDSPTKLSDCDKGFLSVGIIGFVAIVVTLVISSLKKCNYIYIIFSICLYISDINVTILTISFVSTNVYIYRVYILC